MPKFEVENRSGELIIRWKNRPRARWFLLFFALFWNLIVGFFLVAMLASEPENLWFLSFHGLAGIGLIYMVAYLFLNRHEIRAGRGGLSVQTGPVPVPRGNQEYKPDEIDQLFVQQRSSSKSGSRTTYYYGLMALTKSGKKRALVSWLTQKDALELEQRIEDHLGIEDEAIPLDNRAVDMLRKWMPKLADKAEEANLRQQGKSGEQRAIDQPAPRRLPGPDKDYAPLLHQAEPGFLIELNGRNLAMTAGEQYDWEDGQSDRRLTVYDATAGEDYYLFCEQTSAGWSYFEERPLDPSEGQKIGLPPGEELPRRLENGEDTFYPREAQSGWMFTMDGDSARATTQHIFTSTTTTERFRLLTDAGSKKRELFIQERLASDSIKDVLPS